MSINWDDYKGFEDWSGLLDQLLDEATAAIKVDDIDKRVEVQKKLRLFTRKSPNEFSRKLDEIATQAINDIFMQTLEESIQAISSRSSELDSYVKDIQAVTGRARRTGAIISLETPQSIAEGLTKLVGEVKGIKDAMKDNANAQEITKRVDAILSGIGKLREIVEDVA